MDTGSIKLFIGPMFASKTSSMLNAVERHAIANKRCVVVKYADDVRYGDAPTVITHAGHEHATVPVLRAHTISEVADRLAAFDVIGIDEVQFYPDSVETLSELAARGKIVIAAGLDANWRGQIFGRMGDLIAMSEDVIKLKAVCMRCGADASFTHKICGGAAEIEIGGTEKYQPMCRRCWS